jgi:folylpolyglutamate synthase/dihydropteroate synthase
MDLLQQLTLIGANRRSDRTVIELWMGLESSEAELLESSSDELRRRIVEKLAGCAVEVDAGHPLLSPPDRPPAETYGLLLGGIGLALQQTAGHRVGFLEAWPDTRPNHCFAAFEYEQSDTGVEACQLAMHLVSELEPRLALPVVLIENYQGFEAHLGPFLEAARRRVLPRDAEAISVAARRLDIPCVNLDREPYEGVAGGFRIRPNGLLKLGHACHQRIVDGTFPIDEERAPAGLLRNRENVVKAMAALGLPTPRRPTDGAVAISARRAVRAAERVGYPVVVKTREIHRGVGQVNAAVGLADSEAVRSAAEGMLQSSPGVLVEACLPGDSFKLIVADGDVVGVVRLRRGIAVEDVTAQTSRPTLELARNAARKLNAAMLTLTVVSPEISTPLGEPGGVVDLDVAPALDRFLVSDAGFPGGEILDRAADRLVRRLFPAGEPSRIPLVVVTGTNGKTTVSALIERAMRRAGYVTARAGTTGFFVDGECRERADLSGGRGHHLVLECPDAQFGILETARGAAISNGLMFDACDVAVCTNVTADHLSQLGIDTVEQMAEVKEFIVQRARRAVVLNGDDDWSIGMLPRLQGRRAWISSTTQSAEALRDRFGAEPGLCVLEPVGEAEWLVLYDRERRIPLMAVAELPITLGGRLRYNAANALQAAAVCHQQGVRAENIRAVFSAFQPTFEDNPARMNLIEGLPFRVLYDYAHNEDGYRHLCAFVDSLEVEGRRIITFAGVGRNSDWHIARAASAVAGSFDLYICHNLSELYGRRPEEVPAIMKSALVEAGVPAENILEIPGADWPEQSLSSCRPGDLLVFCASTVNMDRHWKLITRWGSQAPDTPASS